MDKLSIKHHIKHLEDQHKQLDGRLLEASIHHDDKLAIDIKKEKLKIKDEIEKFKVKLKALWKFVYLVTRTSAAEETL